MKQNREFTLPGFADSAVSSLDIRVNEYAALRAIICTNYSGRIVNVPDIKIEIRRGSLCIQ